MIIEVFFCDISKIFLEFQFGIQFKLIRLLIYGKYCQYMLMTNIIFINYHLILFFIYHLILFFIFIISIN